MGHDLADGDRPATGAGRPSGGRQRGRLRRKVHRLGVRRSHHQGVEHIDVRVRAYAEWPQAGYCMPTVPGSTGRER